MQRCMTYQSVLSQFAVELSPPDMTLLSQQLDELESICYNINLYKSNCSCNLV